MSNDTTVLEMLGNSLTDLEVRYRATTDFATQQELEAKMEDVLAQYAALRTKLRQGEVIITAEDIAGMTEIRNDIDAAAEKQSMLLAIARTAAFIGLHV